MSDIKMLTNAELQLLRTRFMANPDTLVDPVVAQRLLVTAELYRDGVEVMVAAGRVMMSTES
jgi:hypothetical protein